MRRETQQKAQFKVSRMIPFIPPLAKILGVRKRNHDGCKYQKAKIRTVQHSSRPQAFCFALQAILVSYLEVTLHQLNSRKSLCMLLITHKLVLWFRIGKLPETKIRTVM